MQRRRLQKGSLTLRSGTWYARYYITKNGQRKMHSHKLAIKDDLHYAKNAKALRQKLAAHMVDVNAKADHETQDEKKPPTIGEFWEKTYYPWVEANKRHSTHYSYGQIWNQFIRDHVKGHTLAGYRTSDASKFLTGLAEQGYGRNTISHVRSSLSGCLSHAVNLGLIDTNPVAAAKSLSKAKAPGKTESYSLLEIENLVTCLKDDPECQLLIMLCGFQGLRPSEAQALGWDCVDLDQGVIHLRRSVVRNIVSDLLKTDHAMASLPLIGPVRDLFKAHRSAQRKAWTADVHGQSVSIEPTWVFQNSAGKPLDLKDLVRKRIKPAIAKWNVSHAEQSQIMWKSLYALRRSASSFLWQLTGSVEASQLLLRHRTPNVTISHYLKADRSGRVKGLKMLEQEIED